MKLNSKRTFYVGLAFMSISAFWQVYDGIIPLILKYTFGIGDTWSGAVMALDNVLALFMLPLFGVLSDRTHTRIGRRMPFILAGTAGAVMCLVLSSRWQTSSRACPCSLWGWGWCSSAWPPTAARQWP